MFDKITFNQKNFHFFSFIYRIFWSFSNFMKTAVNRIFRRDLYAFTNPYDIHSCSFYTRVLISREAFSTFCIFFQTQFRVRVKLPKESNIEVKSLRKVVLAFYFKKLKVKRKRGFGILGGNWCNFKSYTKLHFSF